jgi:hypothetical protein
MTMPLNWLVAIVRLTRASSRTITPARLISLESRAAAPSPTCTPYGTIWYVNDQRRGRSGFHLALILTGHAHSRLEAAEGAVAQSQSGDWDAQRARVSVRGPT